MLNKLKSLISLQFILIENEFLIIIIIIEYSSSNLNNYGDWQIYLEQRKLLRRSIFR